MKKWVILFVSIVMVAFGRGVTGAPLYPKSVRVLNEWGESVREGLTQLYVYEAGTEQDPNLYADALGETELANPIEDVNILNAGSILFWCEEEVVDIVIWAPTAAWRSGGRTSRVRIRA